MTSQDNPETEQTMVERVARAMFELRPAYMGTGTHAERWTWEKASPDSQAFHRDNARAAIKAMREPTTAIIAAVEEMAEERYRAAPEMQRWYGDDVWNAGIDAALAEPQLSGSE